MPLFGRALPLLLAAALALPARAGVVASPAGSVFSSPSGAWAGPLGAAFADPAVSPFLPAGLPLSLTSPEGLRAAAPLVQSLSRALSVTPQAFAGMSPADRKGAVELAAEDAREAVRAKAYELAGTARALSQPSRAMDKEGRAELYAAVSKLMEMREHYGPWLDDDGKAAVEQSYALASLKAWEVRTYLLSRDEEPAPVERARGTEPAAPARAPYVPSPSGTAVKLRADMENNKSGWGQDDLDTLYAGYGFVLRQGGKHRMYYHPYFPQLHESVSRQNDLPPGYAQSALKLLRELESLTAGQGRAPAAPATGPPAALTLADLSILLSQPREKAPKERPVESLRARAPPVRARPVEKAVPRSPAPPVTARLAPAAPAAAEPQPEPPTVQAAPREPAGLVDRLKGIWGRMRGGRD